MHRPAALVALLLASAAAAQPPAAPAGEQLTFPAGFFADAQPATAYDMILRVPGFAYDAGDADVRGFAGAAGNVLVDGRRPTSKAETLTDILKRIPASAVLRIELIRGGAGGIDMQGQPVVANVIRRTEAALRGQLEASAGRYGDGRTTPAMRLDLSRRAGAVLTEGSLALARTVDDEKGRGPRNRVNPNGSLRQALIYDEHDGFRTGNFSVAHERPFAGGKLRANLALKRERERAATTLSTSFPAPGLEQVLELETQDEGELGATWDRKLNGTLSLELTGLDRRTRDRASEHSDDGGGTEDVGARSTGGERIGRAVLRWQTTPKLAIEGGGERAFNYLDSHAFYAVDGMAVALPAANVHVAERRAEGFATATWQVSAPLSVEAGVRVETSRLVQSGDSELTKRFVFAKPHLFATWASGPHSQWRLRVERLVGQLDFGDFVSSTSLTSATVTAGNRDLEPDRRWLASLAWERRFWGEGALVLTARHERISHTVDHVGIVGPGYAFDATGNIGLGRKTKLEASLSLPLDRLHIPGGLLKFDGGYRWTAVTDPVTGQRRRISGEEPLDGEIHFTQDRPAAGFRWGVDGVIGKHEREYRFDEVRVTELGMRWSIFAEYRPAPGWTVRAFAENLTGRHVTRERAIYAGPRDVAALRYVETRRLATRPLIGLLARHSFGT
jgi:hypothetical protein